MLEGTKPTVDAGLQQVRGKGLLRGASKSACGRPAAQLSHSEHGFEVDFFRRVVELEAALDVIEMRQHQPLRPC